VRGLKNKYSYRTSDHLANRPRYANRMSTLLTSRQTTNPIRSAKATSADLKGIHRHPHTASVP
jgi:hypothetical protein